MKTCSDISNLPRRALLAAAVLASAATFGAPRAAHADDTLTWNGITFYGVYDIGVAYQNHGAPVSQDWGLGLNYLISKQSNKSITSVAPNGLSQSRLGIKGKEEINDEFSFIFNLEMGFDPQSGNLADGPASLVRNNGVPLAAQKSSGDSSRAGQFFNGQAFGGFSSKDYGTLTLGRQVTVLGDNISKYDPMNGSYALSVIGFSGATAGGGDTQDVRLDDTIKYAYKYDMFRFAGLYQFGKSDASPGEAWQGNVGLDLGAFSIDGVFAHKKDAISFGSLSAAQVTTLPQNSIAATISDNTSYTLGASYSSGPFKVSGGYEHIKYENPSLPVAAGFSGLGGYFVSVVNNTAFPHPKVLEVSWAGVKYLISKDLDITGAYYHYDQNAYGAVHCSNASAGNCSGTLNAYSARLDYRMSKRFDVYAGVMYSKVADGQASGFLFTSTYDPIVGFRFQF